MKAFIPFLSLLLLPGCVTPPQLSPPVAARSTDWRVVATGEDRDRLRDWRSSFTRAVDRARSAGHGAEIAAEGALLQPDAALAGGPIPNGRYRCRIIKLGAKSEGLLDFISYPAFDCRIQQERNLQGFAKLSGSQRPVGLIFPGDSLRQVFLGTLTLGDEVRAMQYGRDADRDVAAWVERIGPARWRMVMPSPRFESLTDVMELVPAG
jgi:hypothetical protein